jgi:hypothetical protein
MTNLNLQNMVAALGAEVLTRDTVYIHNSWDMNMLTPSRQTKLMADMATLVGPERMDYSYLRPLQDAINKLHKRSKPNFIMEPVVFSAIMAPPGGKKPVQQRICRLGRRGYNEVQMDWETNPRVDQVGFRRPGDPYYSVLVTIEHKSLGTEFVYYVTHLAMSKSKLKNHKPKAIADLYARATNVFKSATSAIRCVESAYPVSTHVAACTVARNSDHVVSTLKQHFKAAFGKLRNETSQTLITPGLQLPLLDILVALMRGETPAEVTHPTLRKVMEEYCNSERELIEQQRDSPVSEHVLMVTSFGDEPTGCVFYTNKRNEFYMRQIESLDCLPVAVVGRLQTVAINRQSGTIAGVGAVVPHFKGLLRDGIDCIAVLVTEDELKSVFEGQLL